MPDKLKILFLSRWFPCQPDNGSKLRVYHLLRGLAAYHNVTLLSFTDQPILEIEKSEFRSICSEVYTVPWQEFDPYSFRARIGFLNLKPRSIFDTFSSEMAEMIKQIFRNQSFDLVIASQLSMAAYFPYFGRVPALFEELELGLYNSHFKNSANPFYRFQKKLTWVKLRQYLSRNLHNFQACTVVSSQERELFINSFPAYKKLIEVIPNCVKIEDYSNLQSEIVQKRLIFSGSLKYQANYEAMIWFIREVYPLILKQIPDAHLVVTGDHANLPLPSLKNVTLAGYVEDIKSLIASSQASVAPLLSGGGTRLKILEAMAIGTPVVATSKGAEGLDAIDDEHLLIADSSSDFANQVIRLLKSNILRDQLSANGKQFVKEHYNWESVTPRFLRLVESIIGKGIN